MLITEFYTWFKESLYFVMDPVEALRRVTGISLTRPRPGEPDQFQKQGCHPDVKTMPAAAAALLPDINSQTAVSLTWLNSATTS